MAVGGIGEVSGRNREAEKKKEKRQEARGKKKSKLPKSDP